MHILFTLILVGCLSGLSARLTECTFGVGYRNDHIKTSAAGFLVKEHDLESFLEFVRVETIAEHLLLGFDLDYGILLKGKREIDDAGYKDDYGYEADVFPKIGYSCTFFESGPLCFYFLTSVGYGFSRVSIRSKTEFPLFDTSSFVYDWFGPFVEGKLDLFHTCKWKIAGFYQYHFLNGKIKQPLFLEGTGNILMKSKLQSAFKQVGGISIYYLPISFATLGFEGYVMKGESTKAKQKAYSPTSFEERKVKETFFNYSVLMSVLLWF